MRTSDSGAVGAGALRMEPRIARGDPRHDEREEAVRASAEGVHPAGVRCDWSGLGGPDRGQVRALMFRRRAGCRCSRPPGTRIRRRTSVGTRSASRSDATSPRSSAVARTRGCRPRAPPTRSTPRCRPPARDEDLSVRAGASWVALPGVGPPQRDRQWLRHPSARDGRPARHREEAAPRLTLRRGHSGGLPRTGARRTAARRRHDLRHRLCAAPSPQRSGEAALTLRLVRVIRDGLRAKGSC